VETVTLKDVARAVGVSVMTVSNVVNGRLDRVSPATAARVERAVADLGYVPSAAARTLVARRSGLVGLLLPGRPDGVSLLGSPHDVAVTGALEAALRGRDHHLMLRGVGDARDVRDSVRRWGLDGVVLMGFTDAALGGLDLPPTLAAVLVDADGGAVGGTGGGAVGGTGGGPAHAHVRSDDRAGGRLAGAHLAGLGHRGLVLCGPVDGASRVVAERLAGFREAAADAGLPAGTVRTAHARTTYDEGVALGGRLAADVRAGAVTGVFATADVLAAGVVRGLTDAGLRVPADVSVLGYDDADLARQVTPRLSTVAQDTAGKGRLAAELLLGLVTGDGAGPRSASVPVALVARESTGPAAG
jgi:LacI family transcriptional regulator